MSDELKMAVRQATVLPADWTAAAILPPKAIIPSP